MSAFKQGICAVCWEKKGVRSKVLAPIGDKVKDLIKLYIYDWFDPELDIHPCVICSTCQRNLYLLRDGQQRGAWGEKISKVT